MMDREPAEPVEQVRFSALDKKEIQAPDNYVSVFHATKSEALSFIAEYGLLATATHPERRETDEMIDDNRPAELAGRGVGRKSVYAQFRGDGPAQWTNEVCLELKVDPEAAYVARAELATDVWQYLGSGELDKAVAAAKEYWNQMVTLKDFIANYHQAPEYPEHIIAQDAKTPEEAAEMRSRKQAEWTRNDDAPDTLPPRFVYSEVLVPHNVEPDLIRIAK